MKKIKTPEIGTGRRIGTVGDGPTDEFYPLISLDGLLKGFCIFDCSQQEQAAVAKALREISFRTWRELRQAPRKGVGYETIRNMNATVPPEAVGKKIISFRVSSIFRMIGYREGQVFRILWVDPNGSAYDH